MVADALEQRLEQRLAKLKDEREAGEKMLAGLAARQAALRETMLRISGAIQVLEEELAAARQAAGEAALTTGGVNATAGVAAVPSSGWPDA